MSEFFEEVEEQLRSERVTAIMRKVLPWAAGIALSALLIALGVWGYQVWNAREAAKASQTYAEALDTLKAGDTAKAFVQFGDAANHHSAGYAALALMQQAGIRLSQNKPEEAATLFDRAAKAAPGPILGDMARLKSAFALLDSAPYAALEERLKPLIDAKRPYHVAAREALAMAKIRAGRLKDAREDFVILGLSPDAPEGVRQRSQYAIAAIDSGAAAGVAAAVKAELALPPTPAGPAPQADPQQAQASGAAE